MKLTQISQVPLESLPLEVFRAHLRLGSGFAQSDLQDGVLESYLRAALSAVEARIAQAIFLRGFEWSFADWRNPAMVWIPIGPVAQLLSVGTVDRAGVETPLPVEQFTLQQDAQGTKLTPAGTRFPAVPKDAEVRVVFDAGYGAVWTDVPADLQHAVLMLGAHFYEHRSDMAMGRGCMPFGVSSLLEAYRPLRIGMGDGQ